MTAWERWLVEVDALITVVVWERLLVEEAEMVEPEMVEAEMVEAEVVEAGWVELLGIVCV